mgnify:CR=1 FL=1
MRGNMSRSVCAARRRFKKTGGGAPESLKRRSGWERCGFAAGAKNPRRIGEDRAYGLSLKNFDYALGINAYIFAGIPKIKQHVAILARSEVTASFEMVFRAVVETHDERTKWLALHHACEF